MLFVVKSVEWSEKYNPKRFSLTINLGNLKIVFFSKNDRDKQKCGLQNAALSNTKSMWLMYDNFLVTYNPLTRVIL